MSVSVCLQHMKHVFRIIVHLALCRWHVVTSNSRPQLEQCVSRYPVLARVAKQQLPARLLPPSRLLSLLL